MQLRGHLREDVGEGRGFASFRGATRKAILVTRRNEFAEERMRLKGLGFEFGMELATEEEGMAGDFDYLDIGCVGGGAADAQAGGGEPRFIFAVELVAMAVTLADLGYTVSTGGERTLFEDAVPGAQPHGPAHLFNTRQLAELVDDAVRGRGFELGGVRACQAADVAGILDTGGLHAETDAEVRNLLLAGEADSVQHALDAALSEAAGNQNAVESIQLRLITAVIGSF